MAVSISNFQAFPLSDPNMGSLRIRLITDTVMVMIPGGDLAPGYSEEYSVTFPFNPLFDLASLRRASAFFSTILDQHFNSLNIQFRTEFSLQIANYACQFVHSHGPGPRFGIHMLAELVTTQYFLQEERAEFVDDSLIFGAEYVDDSTSAPSFLALGYDEEDDSDVVIVDDRIVPRLDVSRASGLSEHDISKLKKERFEGKSEDSCCVCLDEFCSGAVITPLSCSHRFHHKCIAKWLRKNRTCPICRSRI